MKNLREQLLRGEKKIGMWGLGYIGYSSMAYFAKSGVRCIGTDPVEDKVRAVNEGKIAIPNMEYWLGFNVKPLAEAGLMHATSDWKEMISNDVLVHLVCVPTEKGAEPYDGILIDVIEKLCHYKNVKTDHPPLVIIESTITPDRVEKAVIPILKNHGIQHGKDILIGVAPRRDWFVSPEKTVKTLPRVVGGTTQETTDIMAEVLGIICDTVLKAPDHRHAAIVKSIENAYRHLDITLANQLTVAYPDIDMRKVLKLVGTKWNIGTYHPSFGTGGYCIPLAPQYVLGGAKNPEKLTLLKEAIKFDFEMPARVVESLVKRGSKSVGILGLAYKGDLKVDILSPTIKIVEGLKKNKINVKVHDPYYSAEELKRILGVETFGFPEGLGEFDTILVAADHMHYKSIPTASITSNLKKCRLILDNADIWRGIDFGKIEYHQAGDKGWLG
jgi:UDP-N-acetyl-D-mannosaminuronic acid dehydrogenase